MSKGFPTGKEGFKAILFLRSFFEHIQCKGIAQDHPLYNRLMIGLEPNYQWLVQYARKLLTASSIKGFESRSERLADSREFLGLHSEIEVALKLYLQDLDTAFCQTSSEHTPDLIVNTDGDRIRVEVTSLHRSDEEARMWLLANRITASSIPKAASGGYISSVPSSEKIDEIMNQLTETIDEANRSREVKRLNFEGVLTLYVAPPDMANEIPEDCRNSYRFILPHARPVENRICDRTRKKKEQLFSNNTDDTGLLFLYTFLMDRPEVFQLFKRMDDVEVMVTSYPRLRGLVLTVPHLEINIASAEKSNDLQKGSTNGKVFLESEAGVYEYESSIIWKNVHSNQVFPRIILQALENYSSNLNNLAPLQESFEGFRTV